MGKCMLSANAWIVFSNKGLTSALKINSLGATLATHCANSALTHSARYTTPCVTLIQANPMPARSLWCTANTKLSDLSLSRALSVKVPGVTTRTTLRSTGPLLVATSPTCSQIATDSPSLSKRAK